jgi:hypothetical protein
MKLLSLLLLIHIAGFAQGRKACNPLQSLPANIEILTHFGERADFSPTNDEIAFMAKSFGDAFVIDLKTRMIRCLTCNVPGAAFLRVMHLANGDYLLIGPERFSDIRTSRHADNELWHLSKKAGSKPVKLGLKMSEGAAVSKRNMRLAVAQTSAQNPELAKGASRILVADVDLAGAAPTLKNIRTVQTSPSNACTLEAQDFFANDSKLTYSCYEPQGKASVWTLDLASGKAVNESAAIGGYNEVEGIFPDGLYTLVESDRQAVLNNWPGLFRNIDIWKLRMDGTGRDFTRVTHFNDCEGWKASNPVVSTDGRAIAFQAAKSADEAGVGYGILLYHVKP